MAAEKILVVNDEEGIREVIFTLLELRENIGAPFRLSQLKPL